MVRLYLYLMNEPVFDLIAISTIWYSTLANPYSKLIHLSASMLSVHYIRKYLLLYYF